MFDHNNYHLECRCIPPTVKVFVDEFLFGYMHSPTVAPFFMIGWHKKSSVVDYY